MLFRIVAGVQLLDIVYGYGTDHVRDKAAPNTLTLTTMSTKQLMHIE